MPNLKAAHTSRTDLPGTIAQFAALLFCTLFGLAMILNNQMAGDAMWYWYAVLFHNGAKLYADLHIALQPLFILQWDAWMNVFGHHVLATESMSVLHVLILAFGIYLFLRESDWPGWQKAILIAAGFVFWVSGTSYRFDDYHVTTESFMLYSVLLLLMLAKASSPQRQTWIALALGLLCSFTITSRLNDGLAILVVESFCILVIAQRDRIKLTIIFAVTAILLTLAIIRCTGDSYSAWLSNSLFRAAASKGGSHSILLDPFRLVINALKIPTGGKWVLSCALALFPIGALVYRFRKVSTLQLVSFQIVLCALFFAASSHARRAQLLSDSLLRMLIQLILILNCLLALAVMVRFTLWLKNRTGDPWDKREILVFVPLAMWASLSTSAAAQPVCGYCAQVVLMLLIAAVLHPWSGQLTWAKASFLTIMLLTAFVGVETKYKTPYFWNNVRTPPMFTHREWYRHPVYGPMYIDTDLLQLSQSICTDTGTGPANTLLSLPFSYANYFCNTPPWHGYVETFFDTTAHATVESLLNELKTSPPEWIVYQRQIDNLVYHEKMFNGGERLPQHDIDDLIMARISTGQWKLVDKKQAEYGNGWYIVHTRR